MDHPWRRCRPCPLRCLSRAQKRRPGRRWPRRPFRLNRPRPAHAKSLRLRPSLLLQPLPLKSLLLRRERRRLRLMLPPCLHPPRRRWLILQGCKRLRRPRLPPPRRLLNLPGPLKPLSRPNLPGQRHRPQQRPRCRPKPLQRRRLTARLLRSLRPSSPRSSTSKCWSPLRKPRRAAQQSGRHGRLRSSKSPM